MDLVELKQLVAQGESDRLEFKKSTGELKVGMQTLWAMLNGSGGMVEEELNSWYTDHDLWPKDLSFKTFKKFFTICISTMVFDLGNGIIAKDED